MSISSEFAHLHLHTQYSLLDGAIRIKDLIPALQEKKFDSVAITDHGNLFGAVEFYKSCKSAGIKPILGSEVDITGTASSTEAELNDIFHSIILVENAEGYGNLRKLVSLSHLNGYKNKPCIDKKMLADNKEGLIVLSACEDSEINQAILADRMDLAKEKAKEYKSIMGPDHFFMEIQATETEAHNKINLGAMQLAEDLALKVVGTNNCHYLNADESLAHEVLKCIDAGKTLGDPKDFFHKGNQYFLKSCEEMKNSLSFAPESISNAAEIASRCNFELPLGEVFLPKFTLPENESEESYITRLAKEGLERRLKKQNLMDHMDHYMKRLNYELGVIKSMGFSDYFLIVWDFINWSKQNNIPVGPGRGSGAGSLVAYTLGITDLNPIPYHLLFERFLNPERVSMPDFDIDFCKLKREKVIHYVTEKYGEESVGQIVTFGLLKARSVIRDVGRVLDIPYTQVDQIAKLVPEDLGMTLELALDREPKLRELGDKDPICKKLIDIALSLEGLNRHTGIHAAGVVIGDTDLWKYVPILKGQNNELVTQFAKDEVEEAGLVKFDFLGLKTLTVIDHAKQLVEKKNIELPDFGNLLFDDQDVYKLIQSGETAGVFQLESSGFRRLLTKLKPDCFEDIIAAVALYRPGPLESGMVESFIRRKHGKEEVTVPHPGLSKILSETYGVIVYQEQVMQIAVALAGFSLGKADLLRKAMGKKKADIMAKMRQEFTSGSIDKGIDKKLATSIFDMMAEFAKYGFNKSHSAAYAVLTYQTAYLKAHHPVEFLASVLTNDAENTDKIVLYINEARAMEIEILPPCLNKSGKEFTVEDKKIRFGFGAIKNVGGAAINSIIEQRRKKGKFKSFMDFCKRVDLRRVNKRVIEALAYSGAFDFANLNRATLIRNIDKASEFGASYQKRNISGARSLFGEDQGSNDKDLIKKYPQLSNSERLKKEKDALGFYISGHPMAPFQNKYKEFSAVSTNKLQKLEKDSRLKTLCVLTGIRVASTKKGRMAFFKIADMFGEVEGICFPKLFPQFENILEEDKPFLLSGKLTFEGEQKKPKIFLETLEDLMGVFENKATEVHIELSNEDLAEQLRFIKEEIQKYPGSCKVFLYLEEMDGKRVRVLLHESYWCRPKESLIEKLRKVQGGEAVSVV